MSGLIGTLIGIIIVLIIAGFVWWAIQQLLPLVPLPEPFARIVHILLVLILVLIVIWVIIVLLGAVGVNVGGPFRLGARTISYAAYVTEGAEYLQRLLGG